MAIQRPDFIARPFAANGDKADIPDQPGTAGRASMADGFPLETQTPITAGGIPPSRLDFNGAFYKGGSQFDFWAQSGGMFPWSADLDYGLPCIVTDSDNILYLGKLESGPGTSAGAKDPTNSNNSDYWQPVNAIVGSGNEGLVPAFGSAPQNAAPILSAAGEAVWQVGMTPVIINGAFDFNTYKANFLGVSLVSAAGTWLNAPPCRRTDGKLYAGFFAVQAVIGPSVMQTYTVYESGAYQGMVFTRTLQAQKDWGAWQPSSYLAEKWSDTNGNWYRKYSDGWIEQGGIANAGSVSRLITYLYPFVGIPQVQVTPNSTSIGIGHAAYVLNNINFTLNIANTATSAMWVARGY